MKILILGHDNPDTDSVLSGVLLERLLKKQGKKASFVILEKEVPSDTREILEKYGVNPSIYQKDIELSSDYDYILVDHHERVLPKPPLMILDHHPASHTPNTSFYHNRKACSTTCVIGTLWEEYLTRDDILLILIGALVDTASFHSTKTNKEDVLWLQQKCLEYQIPMEDYIEEGYCLTDLSSTSYLHGLKKYQEKASLFESSYIQIKDISKYTKEIEEMISQLKEYVQKNSLYVFLFIVHDMESFTSTVYKIYPDSVETISYPEYTSRGNVIVPLIREEIQSKQKG